MSATLSEAERLSYLSAMGIESYVPRIVLPGALPSPSYDLETAELPVERDAMPVSASASGNDALKQLQASLGSREKVGVKPVIEKKLDSPVQTIQQQVSVRFHWVIFQPTAAMLLLVPSAHTDQNCMQLLKKILAAIGIVAPLTPLENFVWPPVSGSTSFPGASSSSLDDAKETLHALLEGYQLKQMKLQMPIEQILVFDENLGKLLFDNANFPGMQLRILPGLQLMLNSSPEKVAELKQAAWLRLKDLKK